MRLFLATLLNLENQTSYGDFARALVGRHGGVLHAVPPGSAHLTYVFSGDADAESLGGLQAAAAACVTRRRAFDVVLGPPRLLMAGPRPRIVCADVVSGAHEYLALAQDLLQAVHAAGLSLTATGARAPHVTLVRFSKQARRAEARAVSRTLEGSAWAGEHRSDRVDRVQLVVSTLTPKGPVYEVTSEWRLEP